jgi:hypothetical protein
MPSREPSYPMPLVASYSSASSLPPAVWSAFKTHEINSNIMYPHAIKCLKHSQSKNKPAQQLWITLSFKHGHDTPYEIDFVLSCTSWALGDYPIFIFTTAPYTSLSLHWLQPRLMLIVQKLTGLVPLERMYDDLVKLKEVLLANSYASNQIFSLRASTDHKNVCARSPIVDRNCARSVAVLRSAAELLQSSNLSGSKAYGGNVHPSRRTGSRHLEGCHTLQGLFRNICQLMFTL